MTHESQAITTIRGRTGRPEILIVGGGASGVLLASQLLKQTTAPLDITIADPAPQLGRGVAYSTESPAHLLNVPASGMSAYSDQPRHFVDWLSTRAMQEDQTTPLEARFVPRGVYGEYLRYVLREALDAAPGSDVQHEDKRIENIRAVGSIVRPEADGTISHRSFQLCAIVTGNTGGHTRELVDLHPTADAPIAYVEAMLQRNGPDADAFILGSGLSAVDVIVELQRLGHRGAIHTLSRHGLLPRAHLRKQQYRPASPLSIPGGMTLARLLRWLRDRLDPTDWRATVDGLRSHTIHVWQRLGPQGQEQFLRHLRSWWDVHRHRMAPDVADAIDSLRRTGRLRTHAGRLHSLDVQASGTHVRWQVRGAERIEKLSAGLCFDASGRSQRWDMQQEGLLHRLVEGGLASMDSHNMGIRADDRFRILNADGQPEARIFTFGPTLKGSLWECTAVPELRGMARYCARHMLASIESGEPDKPSSNSSNDKGENSR